MTKGNIIFHKVVLDKTDTCLTYIFKRLGLPVDFCTYDTFHEKFDQHPFKRKKLTKGDLLLWDRDVSYKHLAWQIEEDGRVITKPIAVGAHFGLYEGDEMFSDCTRFVQMPHPSLRMRKISDLKKAPDWVLTLNENQEEILNQ